MWSEGHLGFSVLYCANRYAMLLNRLMLILERLRWTGQSQLVRGTHYEHVTMALMNIAEARLARSCEASHALTLLLAVQSFCGSTHSSS